MIESYNSTHIKQIDPPVDPRSDPANFGSVWMPWLTDDEEEVDLV